jgi:DNA-binding FadR family transcriptional regulator
LTADRGHLRQLLWLVRASRLVGLLGLLQARTAVREAAARIAARHTGPEGSQ